MPNGIGGALTGIGKTLKDIPFWARYGARYPAEALRGAAPLAGKAALAAGAGYGGYRAGQQLMKWLQPQDWYYNPTAENLARQFGTVGITPYAADIYAQNPALGALQRYQPGKVLGMQTGGLLGGQGVTVAPETQAEKLAAAVAMKRTLGPPSAGRMPKPAVSWDTITDPDTGENIMVGYDEDGKMVDYKPIGLGRAPEKPETITPYQQAQLDQAKTEAERRALQEQWEREWREQEAEEQRTWREQERAAKKQQHEEMMGWYREQAAAEQEERRRQMVAQLAANPRSWLEYASYTGQTPTVQPWMLPLMPQQYGLQTGQPIPGYSPQGMAGMPEMTQPSAQLWSRMGPTAQAQMLGYGTARTGQLPEEQAWRMWSQAPPSGQAGGLQWQR